MLEPTSNSLRAPGHANATRDRRHWLRAIALAFLSVLLVATGAFGTVYHDLQSSLQTHDLEDLLDGADRPKNDEPKDGSAGRALNLLVLGSDSRLGDSDIDGSGASGITEGMRSDTAMLMHISADRSRVDVVSIPRDTLVTIPSCRLPDGSETEERYSTSFNAAFAYGGLTGDVGSAAACSIRTVEELSGLFIDGFMVVDFASFKDVVEGLGGVDMCFSEDVSDPYAGLDLPAGCHHLNGDQALGIARARKGIGDGSDIGRITRQQQLVRAIAKQILSLNLVSDVPEMYRVLHDVTKNVQMSSNIGDLTWLGGLAYSMRGISVDDVDLITLPVEQDTNDLNRVRPTADADAVWQALKDDQQLPEVEPYTNATSPILEGTADEIAAAENAIGGALLAENNR